MSCHPAPRVLPSRNRRAVVLILTAGVLAVLAALGASFYTLMHTASLSAIRYLDAVRAELLAEAGTQYALARLRKSGFDHTEDPGLDLWKDPGNGWFRTDYLNDKALGLSFPDRTKPYPAGALKAYSKSLGDSVGAESDRFTVEVEDASARLNVNACDNLGVVLDNLCRVIGPPLAAADQDHLQPRVWAAAGASAALFSPPYDAGVPDQAKDTASNRDIYYRLTKDNRPLVFASGPKQGTAIYGDGYAIAGYRARHGPFRSLNDVKQALTFVDRNGDGKPDDPLEQLEIELKFAALRPYITLASWVDTNTICVGKFEWVGAVANDPAVNCVADVNGNRVRQFQILMDRDKSWVADEPLNDPFNRRGSLRGCYVSILNGHGAGQLRRIATNGADWIAIRQGEALTVSPGPLSSYIIVAPEDAILRKLDESPESADFPVTLPPVGEVWLPKTDAQGILVDRGADGKPNPIDYAQYPLCIHRAPVNLNSASEKVLAALFMGLNVQHGHPLAVGTDADIQLVSPDTLKGYAARQPTDPDWKVSDVPTRGQEPYLLTVKGLKRIPASSGKLALNRPRPWPTSVDANFGYLDNYKGLGKVNFVPDPYAGYGDVNEAHELAYRVIVARTRTKAAGTAEADPLTADDKLNFAGYEKGPFRSWDDLYTRVIKPWDDLRSYPSDAAAAQSWLNKVGRTTIPNSGNPGQKVGQDKLSVARLIMANFNSNADLLKFNPNIEWIDRFGRNFTEMEPVMVYDPNDPQLPTWYTTGPYSRVLVDHGFEQGAYYARSLRYKSTELIDKSDLNRSTAEFSFDSNGIYEVAATGQVLHHQTGQVLAERRRELVVKLYDVWRESTQRQFVQGTFNGTVGALGSASSGQVSRDATNVNQRRPLVTLPEPLVPLAYLIPTGTAYSSWCDSSPFTSYLEDKVAGGFYNAWGNPKQAANQPDVLANAILPAGYDGQIALATNTSAFDSSGDRDPTAPGACDSFLASFDGDLDTGTCLGNGREQAKTPNDRYMRVVHTLSLLGVLNGTGSLKKPDNEVVMDPRDREGVNGFSYNIFTSSVVQGAMRALNRDRYWENVTCRQGDLRPDGVFLGNVGVSCKAGTIKYLVADKQDRYANFDASWGDGTHGPGMTIRMWFKPNWHVQDHREHEFFNATNPGGGGGTSKGYFLMKTGRFSGSSISSGGGGGWEFSENDIIFHVQDIYYYRYYVKLHGAYNNVKGSPYETPAYKTQPFRWSFVGVSTQMPPHQKGVYDRYNNPNVDWGFYFYNNWSAPAPPPPGLDQMTSRMKAPYQYVKDFSDGSGNSTGFWIQPGVTAPSTETYEEHPWLEEMLRKYMRVFIDTARCPEDVPGYQSTWKPKYHYMWGNPWQGLHGIYTTDIAMKLKDNSRSALPNNKQYWGYQLAAFGWQDRTNSSLIFGPGLIQDGTTLGPWYPDTTVTENFRQACFAINSINEDINHHVRRELPIDGTMAVIDELKLSRKFWRPNDANSPLGQEMTTSRYYLPPSPASRSNCPSFVSQTLFQSTRGFSAIAGSDRVIPVRVSWNAFTLRFMHENKDPNTSHRNEIVHGASSAQDFRGPFDYVQYNYDTLDSQAEPSINTFNRYKFVDRPARCEYPKNQAGDSQAHATKGIEVQLLDQATVLGGLTFSNPDVQNALGTPEAPLFVRADRLRYQVIFRYPVDQFVDSGAGLADDRGEQCVNPSTHYLLDTPVFDDISVTYLIRPRVLSTREVNE